MIACSGVMIERSMTTKDESEYFIFKKRKFEVV